MRSSCGLLVLPLIDVSPGISTSSSTSKRLLFACCPGDITTLFATCLKTVLSVAALAQAWRSSRGGLLVKAYDAIHLVTRIKGQPHDRCAPPPAVLFHSCEGIARNLHPLAGSCRAAVTTSTPCAGDARIHIEAAIFSRYVGLRSVERRCLPYRF